MARRKIDKLVQEIDFVKLGGRHFERLVFAYLLRSGRWRSLDWYGQVGSDLGRDIWGVLEVDDLKGEKTVCVQCANRRTVPFDKVKRDIDKLMTAPTGKPDKFVFVSGSGLSAGIRDDIYKYAEAKEIHECEIYSGAEFEERLREVAESLLRRFFDGVDFPDAASELKAFSLSIPPENDLEALALMAQLFDRPAFTTPFHQESSIFAFRQAINDTIEALNTGIHKLRDGTEIRRIPSRFQIGNEKLSSALGKISDSLNVLRADYDNLVRSEEIKPCGCTVPDCPVFTISERGISLMDDGRNAVLNNFRQLYPKFSVRVGRGFFV